MDSTPLSTMKICPIFEASLYEPNQIAIKDDQIALTYLDLHELANGMESQISSYKGKIIGLLCSQIIPCYILIISLYRSGIPFILINPKLPYDHPIILNPTDFRFIKKSSGTTSLEPFKPAFYFSSSGTTGTPKIIAHSLHTIFNSAKGSVLHYKMNESDRYLANLPLHHVGGFLIFFRIALVKGTILLKHQNDFNFCSLVPTQLHRILKNKDQLAIYRKCKNILLGGAPINKKIIDLAYKADLNISCTYGMSEMASQITAGSNSLGHPLPFRELAISDDNEILCRGENLFLGYGFEAKLPSLKNGFFQTKDLGTYDEINGLRFIGRKDRLIIKGGENIQPEKIESIIMELDEVHQAICVGIENEEYGQVLGCYIEPYTKNIESLINFHLIENLNSFFKISVFFPMPLLRGIKVNLNELK